MLNEMTINAEQVRTLRESRGWSQEHLAEVAGLGLRTIQRVETDGRASRETKLSLAAAFDVPLGRLAVAGPDGQAAFKEGEQVWVTLSAIGTLLVLVGLVTGLNEPLLVAGAAILVSSLATYALDALNTMRRAAGLRPILSSAPAVSGLAVLVTGAMVLLLGFLITDTIWWAPGGVLVVFGAASMVWPWMRGKLVGRATDVHQDGTDQD